MSEPLIHVALLHPEIPGNTGNIGRLCVGVGARLHLVHPLGFDTSDKAVRRAGLDYWHEVDVVEHPDLASFQAWVADRPVVAFSATSRVPYTQAAYPPGVVLLFGKETKGLPAEVVAQYGGGVLIPAPGPIRSLNLSNAAAIGLYEAVRRLHPAWFVGEVGRPGLQRRRV
jgi:tRNA (cytidine/uridine-2'-O-)-methyltransferase